MTKTEFSLNFKESRGWCDPDKNEKISYHFRAEDRTVFLVGSSVTATLVHRTCWSSKWRFHKRNLSGTAGIEFVFKLVSRNFFETGFIF